MIVRNIDSAPLEPVSMEGAEGVRMAIMVGRADGAPTFSLRQFRVDAGGHTPRHAHDYEHTVVVVGGEGTVFLDGEERALRLGDVVYVPAGSDHQFRAGGAGLRFLCTSPVTRPCGEPTPGT